MSPGLLDVRDLAVHFPVRRLPLDVLARRPRQAVRAVDGISLRVDAGELVALVGESGSGKTSIGMAALGFIEASGGSVEVDGRPPQAWSRKAFTRAAQVVFQDPYAALNPRMSVREILAEPLHLHDLASGHDAEERIREGLTRVGLTPAELLLDRLPHELSGGQRQRVALAAAILLEPKLLVADEPVSMLDVSVRASVLNTLHQLKEDGLGILMITHDLATAARYADRIAVLYLGWIVEIGAAAHVVRSPRHPYTEALLSVVPSHARGWDVGAVLHGEIPDGAAVPNGCRFHPRCPKALGSCESTDPQLDGGAPAAACIRA